MINIDKKNDKFIEFCNECGWEEETIGLPYEFCPECSHVNIGFSRYDKKGQPLNKKVDDKLIADINSCSTFGVFKA